jgi:ADP-heptose:LPS heptosyltransferase
MPKQYSKSILVIKLSALGDFIMATGAIQAIRAHHVGDRITLLTTGAYQRLAEKTGCFDEIWLDPRAPPWRLNRWFALVARLRGAGFARVYDLQGSERTGWYFRLLGGRTQEWIGVVAGASHRYINPPEPTHVTNLHAEMLALAGIAEVPPPDVSFLTADVARYGITGPYGLLVPGSAPHRLAKRWPAARFAALARELAAGGTTPVLLGTTAEAREVAEIARACPAARDLCCETGLAEIAALARGASFAVGNDTGPMHLIAAAGCICLALYSAESDPARHAPRGSKVAILREDSLADLELDRVLSALEALRLEGDSRLGRD